MPDGSNGPQRAAAALRRSSWSGADFYAVLGLTLVALALRMWRLTDPPHIVLDETYYAKDACWYVETSPRVCDGLTEEQTQVHPPLGKWLLAVGVRLFGYEPFGWRVSSALFGALTVTLLYILARHLLRSTVAASLAAGLLAIDLLHFVQSRVAMLDVFVPFFGVAAVLCAALDRDRLLPRMRGDPEAAGGTGLLDRPWRLFAGIAGGAATAVKWSGGFYVAMVLLLAVAWELAARRADGRGRWIRRTFRDESRSIFVWLCVLPVLVYSFTFIGRIDGRPVAAPWREGSWPHALLDRQRYMWDFHETLDATHPYQSPAWSWPLLKRAMAYEYCTGEECRPRAEPDQVGHIVATGSPFAWWSSLVALALVGVSWIRQRDPTGAQGVIVLGWLINWTPWMLPQLDRPTIFIFYLLPAVPFMYLAVGWVATRLGATWEAKAAVALFAAGAVGMFAFYYPIVAKVPISQAAWERRINIFDDCDRRKAKPTPSTVTETVNGEPRTRVTQAEGEDLPPDGWCWI